MAGASGVLRVIVGTELSLGEPDADHGLVTWFDVRVTAGEGAESVVTGEARVARIHVGEATNLNEPLYHVLDADSGELEALYDVFFEEDWFRDDSVRVIVIAPAVFECRRNRRSSGSGIRS